MQVLVIYNINDHIDNLQTLIGDISRSAIDAIFVLGNLTAATERCQLAAELTAAQHSSVPQSTKLAQVYAAETARYTAVLKVLGSANVPTYLVPGEHDAPLVWVKQALDACNDVQHMHLMHRKAAYLGNGDAVAGFGGKLCGEQSDDTLLLHIVPWEARLAFEQLAASNFIFQQARHRILLFATPPQGYWVDHCNGDRAGVTVINRIMQTYQPYIVCCGGPSSGRGIERLLGAYVINPGSLEAGEYALLEVDPFHVRLEHLALTQVE